jgi:transposase
MRKAFKYRIYLTNGQRRVLEQQLEECRWTYNEVLAERKRAYEERGESLRLYDTMNMLPVWKLVRPALKLVHSQVLQNEVNPDGASVRPRRSLSRVVHNSGTTAKVTLWRPTPGG